MVLVDGVVRSLSPQERERTMGWPWAGDHTDIEWEGGGDLHVARLTAIGNSLAIPNVRDMGLRIKAHHEQMAVERPWPISLAA